MKNLIVLKIDFISKNKTSERQKRKENMVWWHEAISQHDPLPDGDCSSCMWCKLALDVKKKYLVLEELKRLYQPEFTDESDNPCDGLMDGIHEYMGGKWGEGCGNVLSGENSTKFWADYDEKYEDQYYNSPYDYDSGDDC